MQRPVVTSKTRRSAQRALIAVAVAAATIGTVPAAANAPGPDAPGPDARCASRRSGAPQPAPRLHVALTVDFPSTISSRVTSDAIQEVAFIWARYGVNVFPSASPPCVQELDNVVTLRVIASSQRPNRYATPLGAIEFSPEGAPGDVITVFYDDIVQFALHETTFSPEPQLPAARREQLTGRVLGRVLAHELGHFLLRSTAHADAGLMRSVQMAPDLTSGPIRHFLLSPSQTERLDRLLASGPDSRLPLTAGAATSPAIRSGKTGAK